MLRVWHTGNLLEKYTSKFAPVWVTIFCFLFGNTGIFLTTFVKLVPIKRFRSVTIQVPTLWSVYSQIRLSHSKKIWRGCSSKSSSMASVELLHILPLPISLVFVYFLVFQIWYDNFVVNFLTSLRRCWNLVIQY